MSDPILPLQYPDPRKPWAEAASGHMSRDALVLLTDIIRRLGGPEADFVSQLQAEAYEAKATALAAQASTAAAANYTLTPARVLSYSLVSSTLADVEIAAHTRSTAGAPIVAGTLTGLARGATWLIYYADPTNAGGIVSFVATTDPRDMATAGRRFVDAIFIPAPPVSVNTG